MDDGHGSLGLAHIPRALVRLGNLAPLNLDLERMRANETSEEGWERRKREEERVRSERAVGMSRMREKRRSGLTGLHVGDDGRRSDDETLDAHQLIGVCRRDRKQARQGERKGTSVTHFSLTPVPNWSLVRD